MGQSPPCRGSVEKGVLHHLPAPSTPSPEWRDVLVGVSIWVLLEMFLRGSWGSLLFTLLTGCRPQLLPLELASLQVCESRNVNSKSMRDGEAFPGLVKTLHFTGEETEAQERRGIPRQNDLVGEILALHHPAGLAGCMSPELSSPWPLARTLNHLEGPKYLYTNSLSLLHSVTLCKVYPLSYLNTRQPRVREQIGVSKVSSQSPCVPGQKPSKSLCHFILL